MKEKAKSEPDVPKFKEKVSKIAAMKLEHPKEEPAQAPPKKKNLKLNIAASQQNRPQALPQANVLTLLQFLVLIAIART